jgi:lysophospholipase L1-like esterase
VRRPSRTTLLAATSILLGIVGALILGELGARSVIWYAATFRWGPGYAAEYISIRTEQSDVRGAYAYDPVLGYVNSPNHNVGSPSTLHNSLGFKGREFSVRKASDTKRIVAIGASTTYGQRVGPDDAYPGQLESQLRASGTNVEVINGGVPGYVSINNLRFYRERVLPLEPDLVVVYQGRNDVLPQAYNGFVSDYSHYRDFHYRPGPTNELHKKVFRFSRLAMLLSTFGGNRFGWSDIDESPLYNAIQYENMPSDAELVRNLADPRTAGVYGRVVEDMIALSRENGVRILFATIAVRAEGFATGQLNPPQDPAVYDALQEQVEENNRIVRDAAERFGLPVAETAVLAEYPELFFDDCHMTAEGHLRRAMILYDTILENDLLQAGDSSDERL